VAPRDTRGFGTSVSQRRGTAHMLRSDYDSQGVHARPAKAPMQGLDAVNGLEHYDPRQILTFWNRPACGWAIPASIFLTSSVMMEASREPAG